MAGEMDTGKLEDIARRIVAEELPGMVRNAVEDALTAWKAETGVMTKTEVEEVFSQKVKPLREEMDELKSILNDLKSLTGMVSDMKAGMDDVRNMSGQLTTVLGIIREWPKDLREVRNDNDQLEARVKTNELALRTLDHDVKVSMTGTAAVQMRIFGDPNIPDSPSLLKDLRTDMATKHAEVMRTINALSNSVNQLTPQVAANTIFRENRIKFERTALTVLATAKDLWDDRKWLVIGASLATGALAVLSNPDVQRLVEVILGGPQ